MKKKTFIPRETIRSNMQGKITKEMQLKDPDSAEFPTKGLNFFEEQ